MADLDEKSFAGLKELLRDAEACPRLTQWEQEFLADLRARVLVHGMATRVSDAQWTALQRIEARVYA